jgi:hypothetical protein
LGVGGGGPLPFFVSVADTGVKVELESTVAEVLILKGLGEGVVDELVTWVGREILGEF